ncbi:hypothetical protein LJC08_01875 [Methanimicrococcus sp. OttesenSCG-928-J09]|nr:hypothetical protein [Methanimicrococcus sp. OttesenSCG-928-J09]
MSENTSSSESSQFSAKRFYVIVVIGLLIFSIFAVFSYAAKSKYESGDLTPEDVAKQKNIYAVAKIMSFVGFLIALIPSVKILQNTIQKMREETTGSSSVSVENQKKDENKKEDEDKKDKETDGKNE